MIFLCLAYGTKPFFFITARKYGTKLYVEKTGESSTFQWETVFSL